ncbi:hypothetical protein J6590_033402 [Homalodisca vitripennis]|nr:hypothetical protein J6590_033402 [Homalodisca vitripennis]
MAHERLSTCTNATGDVDLLIAMKLNRHGGVGSLLYWVDCVIRKIACAKDFCEALRELDVSVTNELLAKRLHKESLAQMTMLIFEPFPNSLLGSRLDKIDETCRGGESLKVGFGLRKYESQGGNDLVRCEDVEELLSACGGGRERGLYSGHVSERERAIDRSPWQLRA